MDLNAILALQRQQFELWQAAQRLQQAPTSPSQPQPQPQITPPSMPGMPPGFDITKLMEWQRQQFELWQQAAGPSRQPGGYGGGYGGGGGGPPYRGGAGPGPYRGSGDQHYSPYQPQPPRPKTAAEEFREAVSFVRSAVELANELSPQQQQAAAVAEREEEDDSPVKVIDAGPAKLVINKNDGTARYWETGWANMDKVLKWVGEQRESIQKANADRDTRQQKTLPPGYVEVTPGYKPPPGYVAVPVDPKEIVEQPAGQALPQPPVEMPPPVADGSPKKSWGMPPIMPGSGGGGGE